jgi:polyisoprenoid-binding protein YceI
MKWNIDASHSLVEFSVRHLMITTVKGRFGSVSGTLEFDENNIENSSVEAVIETASIDTRDEKRDAHLRSADFFDVEKYPHLTFKSTKVEKVADSQFQVTGDLTILDVTRSITLNVEYAGQAKGPWGNTAAGFSTSTAISRKDYGLNWNVALETGGWLVGDQVKISLELEAVPAPVPEPVA